MAVSPPPGQNAVSPYLVVEGASQLIKFIKTVFHGEQKFIMPSPEGIVMHGEVTIG